jgi:hypothetical protein
VAPVVIGTGGRIPPNAIIDNDTAGSVEVSAQTAYDPTQDGIDFYESLEGMLVQVNNAAWLDRRTGSARSGWSETMAATPAAATRVAASR